MPPFWFASVQLSSFQVTQPLPHGLAETLEIARDVAKRLMEAQVERGGVRAVSPLEERFDHPLVVSA